MESTKLGKYTVANSNSKEYHILKKEIWGEDIYYFESKNPSPFIIDVGSHIGLSLLYFKSIFPNARILSFEPNPYTFEILRENVESNNLQNIESRNIGIWKEDSKKILYIDSTENQWHSNSSLLPNSWTGKEQTKGIEIQCERLSKYILGNVDMLKIDIEGMELTVVKEIESKLHLVQNIAIEYHPTKENTLDDLLKILNKYFEIEIFSKGKSLTRIPTHTLLTIKGKKREK
jgi:FkbM family methyltransferase